MNAPRFDFPRRVLSYLVFWSWNLVFLSIAMFGILPLCGVALIAEALQDTATMSILSALATVMAVPLLATGVGLTVLRADPMRLFCLFYAVEVPIFLLALGRLFLVRDLTVAAALVLLTSTVGVAAYLYRLLRGAEETRPRLILLALAGDTVGAAMAAYAAAVFAFFALPIGVMTLVAIFRFEWLGEIFRILSRDPAVALLLALGFLLVLFSGTLFALLPPALIVLYARRFFAGIRWASARVGVPRTAAVVGGVSVLLVASFLIAVRQPQGAAFAALAEPPADDAARRARLASESRLRDGLTNAYLAPFRYLGSTEHADAVSDLWRRELHADSAGKRAQKVFNALAAPFVYEGDEREDARRSAADKYAAFFDRSIQRGEKASVLSAVYATYSREEREAGVLTEGRRKVHVEEQDVRVVEDHGDWAELELHEMYRNRTTDQQEVLYSFSLPETAAMTGLWLGETANRAEAFVFRVSPRGAAQRVYRAEVQRRRDPALLEQVGPRQYRLRAFPVLPRRLMDERGRPLSGDVAAPPLHLWMRYRTFAGAGGWPLPRFAEERNAFRDRSTRRSIPGSPAVASSVWLPSVLPVAAPPAAREHKVRVDAATIVVASPAPAPDALPEGRRFAVVLDRSYSMRRSADRVVAAIEFIRARIAPRNQVHLYLTAAASRGEPPRRVEDLAGFDAGAVVFYGGQDPAELLEQFDALRGDTHHDGVVVLTDEGGFDLAGPKRTAKDFGAPLWMVHVGGELAPGYDDATLETIQRRGGGACTRIEEAFTRLAASSADPNDLGWADGYRFRAVNEGEAVSDGVSAIAARRLIPVAARAKGLEGLDAVHAIAREHGVVTPYSSMIVLVNDAQRQALDRAEAQADRFERETETGEARLTAPPSALGHDLTATPEPEEWVLLGMCALGLGWMAHRRRRYAQA